MGQSLVGGLIGGAAGAFQGFITGGPSKALALGAIGFVGGFASSYMAKQATADALSSAMGPSATEPKFGGYNVNRRGAALHHQVIYGQTKVGGVVVFDDAHGANGVANTDNNKYLSRIIAYAGHEIESFEKIYIGGSYRVGTINSSTGAVTGVFAVDQNGADVGSELTGANNPFNGYLSIREVLGGHTTSLDGQSLTNFSDDWTSSHRLLGIAHLAILFEYADDVWDEGLPEVTALIKGKKVYDPRKDSTSPVYDSSLGVSTHRANTESTWEWSDNPALIVRDFLTNTDYGLGEDTTNIDDTLVDSSADRCDETVDVTDPDNPPATIASSRYTCNGAWTTSQPPVDVIAQLMTSCAGYLWYAQGKWRMKAGEDTTPVKTLTEDDLRSPISVATRHSRRDNFNAVRGTFRGPSTNYQFTDYPTVTSSTFLATDNNQESTMDLALPFTDTPYEAQRLANIALEKNRSQITVSGTFGLNAFDLKVGDIVSFTNSRFDWTNERFEVVAWSFGVEDYQLQVNLVLRSITATTYNAIADVTGFESADTNLPGALGEVVVGGGVNETTDVTGLSAESGVMQVNLSWSNPINNNYKETKLYQHGTTNFSSATNIATVSGESFTKTYNTNQAGSTKNYWAQAFDTSDNALGALFGPVSAAIQQVDTDGIADDAITSGQIANNAVDTSQIATGAASKITFASFGPARTTITKNASGSTFNSANWQYVVNNQITGVTSGSKLLVTWNLVVDVAGSNAFKKFFVTLINDYNTVVWQTWPNTPNYNSGDDAMGVQDRATFSGSYIDTNPGSSETYSVAVTRGSDFSDTVYVERASVTITELRKPD